MLLALLALTATAGIPTLPDIQAHADWQEVATRKDKDAGEIQVLKAEIQGVQCFRGEAATDVDPATLHRAASDIPGATRWSSAGVTEARVMSRSGRLMDYYQFLDVPGWTLTADRFWFLRGEEIRDGETITFSWTRLADGGEHHDLWTSVRAEHPDAIEPPINEGGWVFEPTGEQTLIHYYICTDTGGSIPKAVQNAATTRTLPDTIGDVVREARRIRR